MDLYFMDAISVLSQYIHLVALGEQFDIRVVADLVP
jgi:hypothetical protein